MNKLTILVLFVVVFSSSTNYAQSIESMVAETAIIDTSWTERINKPNSFWKDALSTEQYETKSPPWN